MALTMPARERNFGRRIAAHAVDSSPLNARVEARRKASLAPEDQVN